MCRFSTDLSIFSVIDHDLNIYRVYILYRPTDSNVNLKDLSQVTWLRSPSTILRSTSKMMGEMVPKSAAPTSVTPLI